MAEHEHKDEPILRTSPGRMARGIIIVGVVLAIGAAVVVTQFQHFFSNAPPVTRLQPAAPPPTTPPTAGVTTIKILSGASVQGNPDFDPDDAKVPKGNKVVWVNQDNVAHTATSGKGPDDPDSGSAFDTSIITGGKSSKEITVDADVGTTIPYYCSVHPYMTSQLTIVKAEEGGEGAASGPTLTIPPGASVQGNPSYDPNPMTVKAGDTITVKNTDNAAHTVTSGSNGASDAGQLFDTSIISPGKTATIETEDLKPGEYDFFCQVHPYMTGKLQVQ